MTRIIYSYRFCNCGVQIRGDWEQCTTCYTKRDRSLRMLALPAVPLLLVLLVVCGSLYLILDAIDRVGTLAKNIKEVLVESDL